MKFIISRDVLLKNLTAVSGVLNSNNTMAILDNFLFTLEGNKLIITASDLDSTMCAEIELENIEGEGSVAIPSKLLLDTLKLLPETPVVFKIDTENKTVLFSANQGEYNSPICLGDEYPQMQKMQDPRSFDIDANILQRAISKTLFATGNDDMRPTMMGVLCELSSDNITFVATDAHKLVRYRNAKVKADDFTSFILPKKPITHLRNVLAGVNEPVHVEYSSETNHIKFSFANLTLFSSLKEGKFPNYENVIPTVNPNKLSVPREDFLKAIRRVGNFSNQSTYQVRISLAEDSVVISAEDIDYANKAEENITGSYSGEAMSIGFNSKFLREMLENMDSDEVFLEMSQPNRAALILPAEEADADESLLMLIMPVMLNY